jgi:hypothetical protein
VFDRVADRDMSGVEVADEDEAVQPELIDDGSKVELGSAMVWPGSRFRCDMP